MLLECLDGPHATWHFPKMSTSFLFYPCMAKKKKVLDSQATFCKNRCGRQFFFSFFFFISPQNKWGNFFSFFFFNPVKFGLKFKCKQKWKVCVICILPGLRLLGHAARTSLGFIFRVGTRFMQQTLCITQMLRQSSDTDEVCCQNNQS